MKLNLPNRLTLLRVIMIPLFMFFIIFPVAGESWSRIIAAALFGLTAFTDMLDGKIARKRNLITDFGKFLDPLADKMMVFGGMISILIAYGGQMDGLFGKIFVWVAFAVILREMSVTSIRLIAVGKEGVVIAANWLGKCKTVTQIVCLIVIMVEPVLIPASWAIHDFYIFSYITMAAMVVMTLWSGINYLRAYWPLLDPEK